MNPKEPSRAPLGVCILGCGMMGNIHAAHWQALPEARVVAVVDILEQRAQALAQQYGLATWYGDYRQAVALPEVEVVSVCVPTCLHAEMSIQAMQHGKHVLCEKPMALHVEQAEAMLRAAGQHKVRLGIGFMRRHSPLLEKLRQQVQASRLGQPALYYAADIRQVRPKIAMHDAQQNGGPALDMAVHVLDVWAYVFDSQPAAVFAQGTALAGQRPELASIQEIAPDTATLVVRYASGDTGTFVVSWGLPPGVNPPEQPDQVYTAGGLIEANWKARQQSMRQMVEGGAWQELALCEEDMYQREIAAMARWILGPPGEGFPATGETGLAALRVARAALESIETGKAVALA